MPYFKGKSFCLVSKSCINARGCDRVFTQEENEQAIKWWDKLHQSKQNTPPPIMFADLRGWCDKFEEKSNAS